LEQSKVSASGGVDDEEEDGKLVVERVFIVAYMLLLLLPLFTIGCPCLYMLCVALLMVSFCIIITDEPVAKRRRTDGKNAASRFSSDYDRPLHGSGSSGAGMLLKAPLVAFMPRVSHSGKSS
jgi:hypothetical protein